ncbi:MAG: glutamine-hydrolyzing carbamoyl-phosphate synthase small subunit [bacterium]
MATQNENAILVLEDGSVFQGKAIGISGQTVGEVVFNTALTGYQEILTDPSYAKQIVTLTYPHIGNVGCNVDDEESSTIHAAGLIIRDLPLLQSNWRSQESLSDYLVRHQLVAIADLDTRRLTRLLREKGAQNGCIMTIGQADVAANNSDSVDKSVNKHDNIATALAAAREFAGLKGMDLAQTVTSSECYTWQTGSWQWQAASKQVDKHSARFHVVAYDFGVKKNILRMLVDRDCFVTVVPAHTSAEDVLAMQPDGVFLSNGPGDPEPCDYAIHAIKTLLAHNMPLFGICLGHQLLALASGAQTLKMKFGHHGANHPVQNLQNKQVMISSQNHGFAVDEQSLPSHLEASYRSLFDQSLQGIRVTNSPAMGFQGHPEASPGPHDVAPVFDDFIALMEQAKTSSSE